MFWGPWGWQMPQDPPGALVMWQRQPQGLGLGTHEGLR